MLMKITSQFLWIYFWYPSGFFAGNAGGCDRCIVLVGRHVVSDFRQHLQHELFRTCSTFSNFGDFVIIKRVDSVACGNQQAPSRQSATVFINQCNTPASKRRTQDVPLITLPSLAQRDFAPLRLGIE